MKLIVIFKGRGSSAVTKYEFNILELTSEVLFGFSSCNIFVYFLIDGV